MSVSTETPNGEPLTVQEQKDLNNVEESNTPHRDGFFRRAWNATKRAISALGRGLKTVAMKVWDAICWTGRKGWAGVCWAGRKTAQFGDWLTRLRIKAKPKPIKVTEEALLVVENPGKGKPTPSQSARRPRRPQSMPSSPEGSASATTT